MATILWRPLLAAIGVVTVAAGAPPLVSGMPRALAEMSRSEQLSVTSHLHYIDSKGAYLIEEGEASGPLAGRVRARIRVAAEVSGSFTFYPQGGSISGRGGGRLHESGIYASFGGTVTILGGTGRYAHARGAGGFYGVYDRKTLGVTIQTTGTLSY